ncbi:GNAT family N-acetyltransferase [Hyphococcus sp.]|uniref:GNAT family N-acetyltransferase n=1 Tax=Hyphococcus sp. TaxID=2038636 RepID=UPI00208BC982|nr:MAG: N-acetyltransferase [Marinicaulis sp.]
MTSIRRATIDDASALAELGVSTFNETFAHLYAPEDLNAFLKYNHSVEYYTEFLNDPEAAAWVAETPEGEPIGYCTVAPCSLPAPDMPVSSGELCRLYIDQHYQGAGLGKAFIDVALDWLECHFKHLYVGVYSENFGAQKLYQSYGFEKVAEYHFLVGNQPDLEWIMKRTAKKA